MNTPIQTESATGALFGNLFAAYDDASFKFSVDLFERRFRDGGFDVSWFKDKKCLDAGCGGGRYSIAMAHLGASAVDGIDLSELGIADAKRRANDLGAAHVNFQVGSVAALPYADSTFDCVIASGVLMHTTDPVKVLSELCRVIKPGGILYMLVYATEGLRWPLVQMLRPIAQYIGFETIDAAVAKAGMLAPRRRTYLDDLFVPCIDFYTWQCLEGMLKANGLENATRWTRGRLDQEETLGTYVKDLSGFLEVFQAVPGDAARTAAAICQSVGDHATRIATDVSAGRLSEADGRTQAIGQGHHRFTASKA
ncbi:MAG: class I SAM-dependent methyltransferase [Polaromonas sp.]|uniref:class I SAM-dependent methyltransferase n=1 Tax=Polaromonas sp. TaxID=1869339 RepID=UPI0025EA3FBE|nr:class I SAM-dependent methyltransferase [Polaromonas sp.]MBI2728167.1 class I SAM-dependent methyltransferase [Polaromonas sp.]